MLLKSLGCGQYVGAAYMRVNTVYIILFTKYLLRILMYNRSLSPVYNQIVIIKVTFQTAVKVNA